MQVIEGLDNIKSSYENAVVTIGFFDGVHKGHQTLFDEVRKKAAAVQGTTVIVTFDPHPAMVLNPRRKPPLITNYEEKVELIAAAGIDVLVCVHFTREFAAMTARAFVEEILVNRIGTRAVVIGKDYAFGKNREGDVAFLKACCREMGFEVIVVDWVGGDDQKAVLPENHKRISSTAVRELVTRGQVGAAAELLGRYFQVRGEVVSGRERGGASLGFPTANIALTDELCPADGVYAALVTHDSRQYCGVANIGYSPTFDDHLFTVEVHILDFNEHINGKRIYVDFVAQLREEQKFDSIDELKSRIQKDIDQAKDIFSKKDNIPYDRI